MTDHYILYNHRPIAVDLMTWAKWFEQGADNRRVASTNIGAARVSTVFLGIGYRFGDEGRRSFSKRWSSMARSMGNRNAARRGSKPRKCMPQCADASNSLG